MQASKLPLITWFLAFYLIAQPKTGISSLELSRHLGLNYDTAWLLHNKILRAMADREDAYLPQGKIQIVASGFRVAVDSCLGGELPGGKAGRGSENKIPIDAAVSLNKAVHPEGASAAGLQPSSLRPTLIEMVHRAGGSWCGGHGNTSS